MCNSEINTASGLHRRRTKDHPHLSAPSIEEVPSLDESESNDSAASPKNNKNINGYIVTEEPAIVEKLFQAKEDHLYTHKILGFSVLASYIYRFSNLGERDGNLAWGTLFFVAHHLSLNVTSFVFDIPKRRVKTGFRIWPEYRIHSLVFTSRNLACIVRLWMLTQFLNPNSSAYTAFDNGFVNWVIVMLTCAAADYGSSLSAQYQSNTVRGTDYFDPYANWFASEMQFQLTAVCLSAGYQRYSLHLMGAFVIQFNSFLMTLRRKNVASHTALTTTYGVMLMSAMLLGAYEDFHTNDQVTLISVFANLGVILRMGLGVDKYVVWTLLAAGMHVVNYHFQGVQVWTDFPAVASVLQALPSDPYTRQTVVFWLTKFACFGLGLRRRAQKLAKKETNEQVSNIVPYCIGGTLALLCACDMVDIMFLS